MKINQAIIGFYPQFHFLKIEKETKQDSIDFFQIAKNIAKSCFWDFGKAKMDNIDYRLAYHDRQFN